MIHHSKGSKMRGIGVAAIICVIMSFTFFFPATAEGSKPDDLTDSDSAEEEVVEAVDTVIVDSIRSISNAAEAFVNLPDDLLDLIPTATRLDMVDYAMADTVRPVPNSMGGESRLLKLTDVYALVEITPVSTLQIRLLPDNKGRIKTVVTIYTIGGAEREAADSDIRFYNMTLSELRRDKFIKLPKLADFFDVRHLPKETKKDMESIVPFSTMTLDISPEAPMLNARLSIDRFMDLESIDKVMPLMRQNLTFTWDGKKFKEDKTTINTK